RDGPRLAELPARLPATAPSELAQHRLAEAQSVVRERAGAGAAGAGARDVARIGSLRRHCFWSTEAATLRPASRSRPQSPLKALTKSSTRSAICSWDLASSRQAPTTNGSPPHRSHRNETARTWGASGTRTENGVLRGRFLRRCNSN